MKTKAQPKHTYQKGTYELLGTPSEPKKCTCSCHRSYPHNPNQEKCCKRAVVLAPSEMEGFNKFWDKWFENTIDCSPESYQALKQFIAQTRQQARQEVLEEVWKEIMPLFKIYPSEIPTYPPATNMFFEFLSNRTEKLHSILAKLQQQGEKE